MIVRVGLCGFSMSMHDYARYFPVVEVQNTFYEPPREALMKKWLAITPPSLEYTMKVWQLVTHPANSPTYRRMKRKLEPEDEPGYFRDSEIVREGWQRSLECAAVLSATAMLFQCPASFGPDPENVQRMRRFFERIERPRARLLWEPRGPWPAEVVTSVCADCDLVHVVDPFVSATVTRGVTYYRLHGITGSRHVYTDEELRHLRDMVPRTGETYVMFNNIPRANDARRFGALVGEGLVANAPQ
jgi:uncharacterized protein YecE (DUF72 family)